MKRLTKEQYEKLKSYTCNKEKHRFRTNKFGATFCVICGKLSSISTQDLQEDDKIVII